MNDKRRWDSREGEPSSQNSDEPVNSRLFILCGTSVTETDLQVAFEKFGTIKDLRIVKHHDTRESKGVAYIKFSKTSEAAIAVEEMNGALINNSRRALKVLIATNRDQGSRREENEEERYLTLFIVVQKAMQQADIQSYFSQFGDVEKCTVLRDRNTQESKGFAFVKFRKLSHAAKALEGCGRGFKPVFAEPRGSKRDDGHNPGSGGGGPHSSAITAPYQGYEQQHEGPSNDGIPARLHMIANASVNQDQLWRLCDICPDMNYCNVIHDEESNQCFATIEYQSTEAAAYAQEKLHGFEYPTGFRLIVKFEPGTELRAMRSRSSGGSGGDRHRTGRPSLPPPVVIAGDGETYDPSYCTVKLPGPKPLAPTESRVEERLFIVSHSNPPPLPALKDVFGRFGNLIDAYFLNGKNFGYAKYASKESAEEARKALHGQEITGLRIKVLPAEDQDRRGSSRASYGESDSRYKRAKI